MKRNLLQNCLVLSAAALFLNGALAQASSDQEKRVKEFKAGIEKKEATHGGEETKAVKGHEKAASAHHGGEKKGGGQHGTSHAAKGHTASAPHEVMETDPEVAMKRLLEGNKRYAAEKGTGYHRTAKRRAEVARGQHPFAVIVGCADSRVPPELLFDQGVGDLFVVRTAGNVVDDIALGSIEYAVEHLGTRLIVVLGHERCGAVDATLKGGEAPGKIKSVVAAISPAVEKAKAKGHGEHGCDLLCSAVRTNVKMVAEKLRSGSPILNEFMEDGLLKTVGAYYDLDTGSVSLTYKPNL